MLSLALLVLLLLLPLLALAWYRYAYAPYQLFKQYGIPHPDVIPFFGNGYGMLQNGIVATINKWLSVPGTQMIGYYVGAAPFIAVNDPNMVKEITVRHFDNFPNRMEEFCFFNRTSIFSDIGLGLFFEDGEQWKCTRSLVSPAFSSKKLKLMSPVIEKSCISLTDRLEEISRSNNSAELLGLYGQFTMETVLATVLGSHVNLLKGEGNELTRAARALFLGVSGGMLVWNYILSSQLPAVMKRASLITKLSPMVGHFQCLLDLFLQIIQTRRQQMKLGSVTQKDFIQLLINARAEDSSSSKEMLTDREIAGICLDFFLAGYETTSSCLIFTSYLLALNPDKQDLLYEAIDNYYQENEDTTLYDAAHNIPYLDWVIQESLRLHPPAPHFTRICNETCTINGVTFPKGVNIYIPIDHLHHSSQHWDQPEVFEPNRFSAEGKEGRDPVCHCPFGWGPRNCIGMRFALMDAKMALLSAVRRYRFEKSPDTQVPLLLKHGLTSSSKEKVFLKVSKCDL